MHTLAKTGKGVCFTERETGRERVCVCVCVCVRRERERERERQNTLHFSHAEYRISLLVVNWWLGKVVYCYDYLFVEVQN